MTFASTGVRALEATRFEVTGDLSIHGVVRRVTLPATLLGLVRTPQGGVRARLSREHHRSIVDSLVDGDPRRWYPVVHVPVLLCPATAPPQTPDGQPDGQHDPAGPAAAELLRQSPSPAPRRKHQ